MIVSHVLALDASIVQVQISALHVMGAIEILIAHAKMDI